MLLSLSRTHPISAFISEESGFFWHLEGIKDENISCWRRFLGQAQSPEFSLAPIYFITDVKTLRRRRSQFPSVRTARRKENKPSDRVKTTFFRVSYTFPNQIDYRLSTYKQFQQTRPWQHRSQRPRANPIVEVTTSKLETSTFGTNMILNYTKYSKIK